jgi:hypothetical protein
MVVNRGDGGARPAWRGAKEIAEILLGVLAASVAAAATWSVLHWWIPAEVGVRGWGGRYERTPEVQVLRGDPQIEVYDYAVEDGDVVEVGGTRVTLTRGGARFMVPPGATEVRIVALRDGYGGITVGIRSLAGWVESRAHRPGDVVIVPIVWR